MNVVKIVLEIRGEKFDMTLEEAKELQRLLNNTFGVSYGYPYQITYTDGTIYNPDKGMSIYTTETQTDDNTKEE